MLYCHRCDSRLYNTALLGASPDRAVLLFFKSSREIHGMFSGHDILHTEVKNKQSSAQVTGARQE